MEDYGQLEKIVEETIKQSIETKQFNFVIFLQNMEAEFTRLGFRENFEGGIKNILIIRLDAVGDFILTSAAIPTIRENFPAMHITLVVSKNLYELAELCPYVNEVFAIEQNQNFSAEMPYSVTNFAKKYLIDALIYVFI